MIRYGVNLSKASVKFWSVNYNAVVRVSFWKFTFGNFFRRSAKSLVPIALLLKVRVLSLGRLASWRRPLVVTLGVCDIQPPQVFSNSAEK